MHVPRLRVLALVLPLPIALLSACAGDDGDTMGSDTTSGGTTASTGTTDATDATDATDVTGVTSTTGGESDSTTTDDTNPTTSTTDPTTGTTDESTGVATDATTTTTSTTTSTTDTDSTTDDPTTGGGDQVPPIDSVDALLSWLEAGNYKTWQAESGIHQSTGPHGGQVRTFLNDALYDSFSQGLTAHPQGAVAVKELWGDGQMIIGYAVEVKVDADSDGGNGWYWYEKIGMTEYGGSKGVGLCTGCHGGGVDYVLTPWPLQ